MKNLVIFFSLTIVLGTSTFASQAKESEEYRAGKLSAYADYCGMANITQNLFEFFGGTIDYKQGYSENYIWTNNNTPSLSSKCDEELREAAKKLLEPQPTSNKPTRDAIHESNFSNSKICKLALAPVDNIWDYSTFASKEAIREARERGLTIRSCAELLGRAKRLNSDTQNKPGNTVVSSESDVDICKIALSKTITAWNPTIYAETSVKEARKRHLLPSDCARILATGQQKTASDRPSIADGTNLPKGTQTKQLDLAKRLAHLERLLVRHQNDNNNLKQELNRLKATKRQNLLSIERLKKKQDQLLADLNLIIRINQDGIEKLARIDNKKFDALKPLLERKHSRKKEEVERKAEERQKAAEAARKAKERRKAAEAARKEGGKTQNKKTVKNIAAKLDRPINFDRAKKKALEVKAQLKKELIYDRNTKSIKGWAAATKYEDLARNGGIYYYKFSERRFNGKVTGKVNGIIKSGLPHGEWIEWKFKPSAYSSGKIASVGRYSNGKKDGTWYFYHRNYDSVKAVQQYSKGKKHGEWITWSSGLKPTPTTWGVYVNGRKEGKWRERPTGHQIPFHKIPNITNTQSLKVFGKQMQEFNNLQRNYLSEAKFGDGRYKNGLKQGYWTYFQCISYRCSYKYAEGSYKDGCRVGIWKIWSKKGTISGKFTPSYKGVTCKKK